MLELTRSLNRLFAVQPARKPTKAQAFAAAKRVGCTIVISGDTVSLDPPKGMTFEGDSHYRDFYYCRADGELWGDIWQNIVETCSLSIEPCEMPECDCSE